MQWFMQSDVFPRSLVTDPGFSQTGDTKPKGRGTNLIYVIFWPENCMKMKEIGSTRGARRCTIPGSSTDDLLLLDYPRCQITKLNFFMEFIK